MTRYENAARGLAKGDAANRLATKDFMALGNAAGHHFAALERDRARRERGR